MAPLPCCGDKLLSAKVLKHVTIVITNETLFNLMFESFEAMAQEKSSK